jgi:DNA polymerase sigma
MIQLLKYKVLIQGFTEMAFLFPTRAPIIEVIIDSTNPPHIGIHIDVLIQKFGSIIAGRITKALHISRTYQILLGFFLTFKIE